MEGNSLGSLQEPALTSVTEPLASESEVNKIGLVRLQKLMILVMQENHVEEKLKELAARTSEFLPQVSTNIEARDETLGANGDTGKEIGSYESHEGVTHIPGTEIADTFITASAKPTEVGLPKCG